MPDGPRVRGFLATPEPREKNAMEGALRGLRLALECLVLQAMRHEGVTRGAARALRANATAY